MFGTFIISMIACFIAMMLVLILALYMSFSTTFQRWYARKIMKISEELVDEFYGKEGEES